MTNALKRVANYLGLMDDPEFDTHVASSVPAVQSSNDVRIKTRAARSVSSVHTSTVELARVGRLPMPCGRCRSSRSGRGT